MKEYEQKICNIIDNLKAEMRYQCDKVNEQAYKQGHKRGYAEGYELGKQDGYEDGKADTPFTDTKDAEEKVYNRGLSDVWDAVRKIIEPADDGGYSFNALHTMFGESSIRSILKHNTAIEAIVKIKAYEDKQKQDTEIKLGDEVITKYKDHAIAVRDTYYVGEDREPFTLIWFGTHMSSCRVNELSKTGRHFPQITEVLKELRGAENADITD